MSRLSASAVEVDLQHILGQCGRRPIPATIRAKPAFKITCPSTSDRSGVPRFSLYQLVTDRRPDGDVLAFECLLEDVGHDRAADAARPVDLAEGVGRNELASL